MASKRIKIVQGQDATVLVDLINRSTQKPQSLSGFTSASAFFKKTDSTSLAVSGALLSADCGKLQFVLSDSDTGSLAVGDELDFEVVVDLGTTRLISQIVQKLEVAARLFP